MPADEIRANTFHAFGLSVIGTATGRKPSLASWLQHPNGDVEKLARIVDELRDSDETFRSDWDLYRMVFGRDTAGDDENEEPEADWWDASAKRSGHRTLRGDVVKSFGELQIANWLFYNGVEYEYEPRYEVDTADATHRQYTPDFYYPAISVYHEHFGVDENGQAKAEFIGYAAGMEWKRSTHAEHGTDLIETTWGELRTGALFDKLAHELTSRGVELDPNPERPALGQPPIENERLIGIFRSFMLHAKGNQLSDEQLVEQALSQRRARSRHRHERFLALYRTIRDRWEAELAREQSIDFEDMLNLAADYVESGQYESPFDLVMVDEMQDASLARARLARALVAKPGRYLFAVGDDWQSINRFAGADLAVMTQFESWFSEAEVLKLERTFRCPQPICDVSSRFVMKNPDQLPKRVVSSTQEYPPSVVAIAAASDDHSGSVIRKRLAELNEQIESGAVPAGRGGRVTVFVLGRYRHQESLVPHRDLKKWRHLEVRFSTIHSSKGLEADYVIIPGLARWRRLPQSGFG